MASTASNAPPCFASLPTELVEKIAMNLDRTADLLSLRATSRAVRKQTNDAFVKHFSSADHPFYTADEGSMKILLATARDPLLAPRMKSIYLCFSVVEMGRPSSHSPATYTRLVHRKDVQEDFRGSDRELWYFRAILRNFDAAGHNPAIMAGNFNSFLPPARQQRGVTFLRGNVSRPRTTGQKNNRPHSPIDNLIRAVIDTRYQGSEMQFGWLGAGVKQTELTPLSSVGRFFTPVIANLVTLRLVLYSRDMYGPPLYRPQPPRHTSIRPIISFLREARNLRVLGLRKDGSDPHTRNDLMLTVVQIVMTRDHRGGPGLRNLRELELKDPGCILFLPYVAEMVSVLPDTMTRLLLEQTVLSVVPMNVNETIRAAFRGDGEALVLEGPAFEVEEEEHEEVE